MKITVQPEHADMPEMDDWLAELRDGENAEPTGPGNAEPAGPGPKGPGYAVPTSYAVPASPGHAESASYVRAVPAGLGYAVPVSPDCTEPAGASARPEALAGPIAPAASAATAAPARTAAAVVPTRPAAPTAPAGPAGAAVRAVIGDQLRMPIMWCEMGSCVSWHADPAALGEADTRARAIDAGWRIDALGRLACPQCQQNDSRYWAARPVVPWDRHAAIARTTRIQAAARSSGDPGRAASGYPPPSRAELEWHHDPPADEAMPAGRYAGNPVGTSHSRGAVFNAVRAWRARGGRQAAPRQASEPGEDLMIAERATPILMAR
ncbi:MAG TPA: hypothetical protein VEF71_02580 [Streptosporangiaceae bacterium]|nr:hypothetical protein [Streptosporangiaceae bacterium]